MPIIEVPASASLEPFLPAWEDLVRNACEANSFFEPWAFLPAWRHLAGQEERCLLVYSDTAPKTLIAFIPISPVRTYRHLPLRHFGVWRHLHCFLGTPLIRAGATDAALTQLMSWIEEIGHGYAGFEFPYLYIGGKFAAELRQFADTAGRVLDLVNVFERAFLVPGNEPQNYLERALKKKHRKDLDRKMELLQEQGEVAVHVLPPYDPNPEWTETFLTLEGSGWKGAARSSLSYSKDARAFFKEFMERGAAAGQLIRQLMTCNGAPVCARISMLSGSEALSFKIAYDERWSKYSPGMLLEVANLRWALSQDPALPMDSCAAPGTELFKRLWLDSRGIQSILVSKSSFISKAMIEGLGGAAVVTRAFRKKIFYGE